MASCRSDRGREGAEDPVPSPATPAPAHLEGVDRGALRLTGQLCFPGEFPEELRV